MHNYRSISMRFLLHPLVCSSVFTCSLRASWFLLSTTFFSLSFHFNSVPAMFVLSTAYVACFLVIWTIVVIVYIRSLVDRIARSSDVPSRYRLKISMPKSSLFYVRPVDILYCQYSSIRVQPRFYLSADLSFSLDSTSQLSIVAVIGNDTLYHLVVFKWGRIDSYQNVFIRCAQHLPAHPATFRMHRFSFALSGIPPYGGSKHISATFS